ncbi:2Fe-2S iron-sulfur cluster-binding protein [Massilia sp. 9I]|uniref:2Fe-2S iron-sulfur cluster-binding protein n=1 Tax=Massilia sp. 9I TaxID=2653152 RepID=UPI0012F13288|nr:2Fe-2S iron-sulfur cluster-binding protein [Massilia sp. 9I]VXB12668.1 Ferredoxin--NAD(P)(+) reductase CarAd [Massilia sp. 9I]
MKQQFQIRLAGSDDVFDCDGEDTLLRAGLRQGLGIAYECNVGACGSCKFDLVEGEVEDLFPEATGLRQKERERGKRLACQCIPRGNCTIKIRTGAEYVPATPPRKRRATLASKTALTGDISLFEFAADGPAAFLPGQYALIGVPGKGQLRAYSLSNLPNPEGRWQFGIRRVPGGTVSNALFDAVQAGDEVVLDGPYGIAYLREKSKRPVACIGGGSGLAPLLSIVRGAALAGTAARPIILYGGRGPGDIPDVAAMLADEDVPVDFHPVVSMPDLAGAAWSGDVGFVHEFIPRKLTQPLDVYEYYLAGPPPMIEAAVRLLMIEAKVPATQIHFDRFF